MSTKLRDLTEVCQRCQKPRGAHKADRLSCPVGKKHRTLGYLDFSSTSFFSKAEAAVSPPSRPVGMDRSRYPVAPEAIVESLKRLHAGYIESKGRCHHRPVRLADLVADLKIPPAKVSLLRQQLQDMQHHRFAEFGVHHAYYPTGWQVRLPEPIFEERLPSSGDSLAKALLGAVRVISPRGDVPDASSRDHIVAMAVIHWLGTSVGQLFFFELMSHFEDFKNKRKP